jgi:hypothetical protein
MAKELPYFQFEPAEYLTKDVSFCSLSAQGLFINICSYYWQRQCDLSKEQFLRRFNYENEFNELVKEGVIDLIESKIVVKFLLSQYLRATEKSTVNSSNGAKGGRPKNPIKSETKANENPIKSETKGIREEKIIKEEKKYKSFAHLSISFEEVEKLKSEYSLAQIDAILESIENYKNNKNYVSLYLTAKKWLAKEYPKTENNNGPSKTNQKLMIYDND